MAAAAKAIYAELFPGEDAGWVDRALGWATDFFTGRQPGYQAVDIPYHDFEHTLQVTLCLTRILAGRARAGAEPVVPARLFELGLLAALLHDTGYLKSAGDQAGTGAKFTFNHVARSAHFAAEFLTRKGFGTADVTTVQRMIHCTRLRTNPAQVDFASPAERVVACALGTADLLGQMAADDYVDKLPGLHAELMEGMTATPDLVPPEMEYPKAVDLLRTTPGFWRQFSLPRLVNEFGGLHRYLAHPPPEGPNEYLQRVEANIARVERELSAHRTRRPPA